MDPTALRSQLRARARPETVHTAATEEAQEPSYADASYWNDRYAKKDDAFEWLCGWEQLAPLWRRRVTNATRVLHAGCGTSLVGADLGAVNVDISLECIDAMRKARPDGDWRVADCLALPFADDSFDAVLDKGTLDAFCCDRDATAAATHAETYVRGAFRVLRPGGALGVVHRRYDPECAQPGRPRLRAAEAQKAAPFVAGSAPRGARRLRDAPPRPDAGRGRGT